MTGLDSGRAASDYLPSSGWISIASFVRTDNPDRLVESRLILAGAVSYLFSVSVEGFKSLPDETGSTTFFSSSYRVFETSLILF